MKLMFPMMMAAVTLCVAGTPALAQFVPHPPAKQQTISAGAVPNGEARKTATKFSACLVDQAPRSVRMLLDLPYSIDAFDKSFARLHTGSTCLAGKGDMARTLNFPRVTMRSFLFDALYREEFGAKPAVSDFTSVQPLTYAVDPGLSEEFARPYLVNMALGDCVSRQAPAEARAFLLTRVETPEETAALQALAPAFQMCLPQGAELKLTRWKARATIAEPLYRLTQAQVK
jgi:hypothetical protein